MARETLMKALLVGGNPEGYTQPFDERTRSGRVLRKIVREVGLDAMYLDLFPNPRDEQKGHVTNSKLWKITFEGFDNGREIVALGHFVVLAIKRNERHFPQILPHLVYLPHPACRNKAAIERLRTGLRTIAKQRC